MRRRASSASGALTTSYSCLPRRVLRIKQVSSLSSIQRMRLAGTGKFFLRESRWAELLTGRRWHYTTVRLRRCYVVGGYRRFATEGRKARRFNGAFLPSVSSSLLVTPGYSCGGP